MTFEEYLKSKNIDSKAFKSNEPDVWQEWDGLFSHLHPNSFNEQKKFLINPIRRKYLLSTQDVTPEVITPAPEASPASMPEASTEAKPPMPRKGPIMRKKTE